MAAKMPPMATTQRALRRSAPSGSVIEAASLLISYRRAFAADNLISWVAGRREKVTLYGEIGRTRNSQFDF